MSAAGVELAFDMTQLAVTGITDVLKNYFTFRQRFHQLLTLAQKRKPDAVIGVDFGGFNLRLGHAIKTHLRQMASSPSSWNPKIIQFVSPQVWASRPGRAKQMAADYDLLLSIFPFEKAWYAQRTPKLRVEFVGQPPDVGSRPNTERAQATGSALVPAAPRILLLPGSRRGELRQHLPVMLAALKLIQQLFPVSEDHHGPAQCRPLVDLAKIPWCRRDDSNWGLTLRTRPSRCGHRFNGHGHDGNAPSSASRP